MRQKSTLRRVVDQQLQLRHTSLAELVHDELEAGGTINTAAAYVANLTGVPVSYRTVYRWVADLEKVPA